MYVSLSLSQFLEVLVQHRRLHLVEDVLSRGAIVITIVIIINIIIIDTIIIIIIIIIIYDH